MNQPLQQHTPSTRPDSIAEAKLGATGDDVFLSPRVIDDAAFERMTEVLRHLIAEAARSGESIRSAVGSATRVLELYRDAETSEASASAVALQDAVREAERLESTLARSRDEASLRTDRLERVSLAASDAIERQRVSLESIVASVRKETMRATSELRQAIDASKKRATQVPSDTIEQVEQQLDALVDAAIERADAKLKKQLRSTYRQGKTAFEALDAKLAQASKQADEIDQRMQQAQSLQDAIDDEKLSRIEAVLAALKDGETLQAADRLIETMPKAEQAGDRLVSLVEQSRVAQKTLADSILDGAAEIDRLADRAAKGEHAA